MRFDSLRAGERKPHWDDGDKPVHGNHPTVSALVHGGSENAMPRYNGPSGSFSLLLGGILDLMLVIFMLAGGELGQKKVQGDADMPPISSPEKNFR
jgi:hypothetical protein